MRVMISLLKIFMSAYDRFRQFKSHKDVFLWLLDFLLIPSLFSFSILLYNDTIIFLNRIVYCLIIVNSGL